jgi:hypothetical protein
MEVIMKTAVFYDVPQCSFVDAFYALNTKAIESTKLHTAHTKTQQCCDSMFLSCYHQCTGQDVSKLCVRSFYSINNLYFINN